MPHSSSPLPTTRCSSSPLSLPAHAWTCLHHAAYYIHSSPGQETKGKKKPMKSLYLKFFETAPDGKSRICRLCRKSYCMTTATGKWSQHAMKVSPKCFDVLCSMSEVVCSQRL